MKHWIMLIVLCAVFVGGCASVLKEFRQENPNAAIVIIDEDGDGLPEAYGADEDGDGVSDREIPGSREQFEQAGMLDGNIGLLLATIATVFPAAGILGRLSDKIKPTKRTLHWQAMTKGLIKSFQTVRESGEIDADTLKVINQALHTVQKEIVGLETVVATFKAEAKSS